jgi:undecaprenyl-diphosphatase
MDNSSPLPTPDHPALDSRLCWRANRWGGHRRVRIFFGIISKLGDGWIWYALMLAFALCFGARGLRAGAQMLCTGLVAWQLYRLLKCQLRRPRPYRAHPQVVAHLPPLDEYSFPSGHTLHAVSFSVVAAAWFPALILPLAVFTALVAASRVVLGLHYPTDVLAGALLGVGLGAGSLWSYSAIFGAIN